MCYKLAMHSVFPPFRKFARFHFYHISGIHMPAEDVNMLLLTDDRGHA
jgi:hypothetical protein